MIRTNNDLYATVDELVRTLDGAGEQALASALRGALGISSLPGEILGETRIQLRRVRESSLYKRVDVRSKVDDSVRYIDSVLGG